MIEALIIGIILPIVYFGARIFIRQLAREYLYHKWENYDLAVNKWLNCSIRFSCPNGIECGCLRCRLKHRYFRFLGHFIWLYKILIYAKAIANPFNILKNIAEMENIKKENQ